MTWYSKPFFRIFLYESLNNNIGYGICLTNMQANWAAEFGDQARNV